MRFSSSTWLRTHTRTYIGSCMPFMTATLPTAPPARALSLCRTAIASRSDEKGQNESVFWVSFALAPRPLPPSLAAAG